VRNSDAVSGLGGRVEHCHRIARPTDPVQHERQPIVGDRQVRPLSNHGSERLDRLLALTGDLIAAASSSAVLRCTRRFDRPRPCSCAPASTPCRRRSRAIEDGLGVGVDKFGGATRRQSIDPDETRSRAVALRGVQIVDLAGVDESS
jgi:hypothetical protein